MVRRSSSPGKLVVLGEYAVLEGSEALVAALDRRTHVTYQAKSSQTFSLRMPPICDDWIEVSTDDLEALDCSRMVGTDAAKRAVENVVRVLASLAPERLVEGAQLEIDTTELFDVSGQKLGLGSSAAVTVALAALADSAAEQDLHKMHQAIFRQHQGGRGSGLDLASALIGGTVVYKMPTSEEGIAQWQSIAWPEPLHGVIVFVGQSASTPDLVAAHAAWKSRASKAFDACHLALSNCVNDTIKALYTSDFDGFLSGFTEYGQRIGTMGELMGRSLVTPAHEAVDRLARRWGVNYKTCGAGGGDTGLLLSLDQSRLDEVSDQVEAMGLITLPFRVSEQGLVMETEPSIR